MKKCPICKVNVKLDNLEKHVRKLHPHDVVNFSSLITEKERKETDATGRLPRSRRNHRVIGASIAIIIIVVLVAIAIVFSQPSDIGPTVGNQVGQIAPDFTLQTTDNIPFSLSSMRGQPVILIFIDIDGLHCQQESEILASVYQNFSSSVQFFTIDVDMIAPVDTIEKINDFRIDKNTPWPYALDSSGSTMGSYGILTRPCVFVIDENGVIQNKFVGRSPCGCDCYSAALNAVLQ